MSKPVPTASEWTYARYAALPDDGNKYEVIAGEVYVTPRSRPIHQHVAANLFFELRKYVQQHDLGVVLDDVDLLFVSGEFLSPDILFVPNSGRSGITDRGIESKPGLVVEVLSPQSGRIDRILKPARYREHGVTDYWVVDPSTSVIERYRLDQTGGPPIVCKDRLTWQPDTAVDALVLDVAVVFVPL